jgi:hypothetical protein
MPTLGTLSVLLMGKSCNKGAEFLQEPTPVGDCLTLWPAIIAHGVGSYTRHTFTSNRRKP